MKRTVIVLLFAQWILLGYAGLAQTAKILYIYPEQSEIKYKPIRMEISKEIKANLQAKFSDEFGRITWESIPDKKSLLNNPRVDYVLLLNDLVIKGNEKNVKLTFEFYRVEENYKLTKENWPDNEFMMQLSQSQEPMGTDMVIKLVCDEIDIFIASSSVPRERKFRPRIKISMPELASDATQTIQVNTFARELNQMLESKYSADKKYVFYFNQRQFPKESNFEINSKIWGGQVSSNQLKIELIINFYTDYNIDPTTLEDQKYLTDEKTVQQLVNKIANVLDSEIMYYDE